MSDPRPEPLELPSGSPATTAEGPLAPLQLDPDEYREHLAEFDMTEEQQNELLGVLWNIMRTFVEIGFGLDSVQMFSVASDEKSRSDSGNRLQVKNTPHQFNQAALDYAAKEGSDHE